MRSPRSLMLLPVFLMLFLVAAPTGEASVEYTIKKGDNLSRIAKEYHISLKELQRANKLSARHMKPGVKIIIPVSKPEEKKAQANRDKKGAVASDEASAPGPLDEAASSSLPAAENLYHTVRKGDTLAAIARRYSISAAEIKELNNLRSSKLRRGRKLLVKHIGPKTYTVKRGDNFWKIAKKFDMEADDLMQLNELESASLTVGQKLYLEQKVDPATAANIHEAVGKGVEEEIKKVSESEEFAEQPTQDRLIVFAKKLINIPYKFGGNSILGIDCSAYVKKVYGLLGIELPRTAREQFRTGETVEKDDLSIGDLVFFRTYASFPSHVGIYLGNNLFIHASSRGKKVTIDSLETPYYLKRFIGGKRLLTEETSEKSPNS